MIQKGGRGMSVQKRITDEKLNKDFERFDVLTVDYVQKAKAIALKITNGEPVDIEDIKEIRLAAVNDRKNLKGDFVISMFLDIFESNDKAFKRWDKGKMIRTNDKELERVFLNHFSKDLSVTDFCKKHRMTRSKYYRIVNCDVKNADAKEQLESFKEKIQKEFQKRKIIDSY